MSICRDAEVLSHQSPPAPACHCVLTTLQSCKSNSDIFLHDAFPRMLLRTWPCHQDLLEFDCPRVLGFLLYRGNTLVAFPWSPHTRWSHYFLRQSQILAQPSKWVS